MTPKFPQNPNLPELQTYVAAICKARGWDQATDLETFLLFIEEVGELAKEIRNRQELFQEPEKRKGKTNDLEGEFADVLSYLLDLANRMDIDLEAAFRKKEEVNSGRVWE